MQAVAATIDLGNNRDEVVAAARNAALAWDAQQQQRRAPQGYPEWRAWTEREIGGSAERIDAVMQTAAAAVELSPHSPDDAII
jgi:hypothetical protein